MTWGRLARGENGNMWLELWLELGNILWWKYYVSWQPIVEYNCFECNDV